MTHQRRQPPPADYVLTPREQRSRNWLRKAAVTGFGLLFLATVASIAASEPLARAAYDAARHGDLKPGMNVTTYPNGFKGVKVVGPPRPRPDPETGGKRR